MVGEIKVIVGIYRLNRDRFTHQYLAIPQELCLIWLCKLDIFQMLMLDY